jgi:hypothetical protein
MSRARLAILFGLELVGCTIWRWHHHALTHMGVCVADLLKETRTLHIVAVVVPAASKRAAFSIRRPPPERFD